jgi:hypothetical protein
MLIIIFTIPRCSELNTAAAAAGLLLNEERKGRIWSISR